MKRLAACFLGSLLALAAAPASATPITFGGTLGGATETPPNASPGFGVMQVVIDPAAHTLDVSVIFNNLVGLTTASHIHCCTLAPFTGSAGVATEVPTFANLPLGVTSGSFTQSFDTLLDSTYNPAFEAANGGTAAGAEAALFAGIMGGEAYLNIHTDQFPGGEISGFLFPLVCDGPNGACTAAEPATLSLLGMGLFGAFSWRRRRST